MSLVEFVYENHRGALRAVRVDGATALFWDGTTAYYPEHQTLLTAWDLDRCAERTFAIRRVRSWGAA